MQASSGLSDLMTCILLYKCATQQLLHSSTIARLLFIFKNKSRFQIYLFITYPQGTGVIIQAFYVYMYRIIRKKMRNPFGPLYQANVLAVYTIFHTGSYGFFFILQAVKINMVNGMGSAFILINNRKGRTANRAFNLQVLAQRMHKSGFAGTHLSVQGKNFVLLILLPESRSHCINFL